MVHFGTIKEVLRCPKCHTMYPANTDAELCGDCGTKLCKEVTIIEKPREGKI
jgi:rRNA maturation endonuclease Nob1